MLKLGTITLATGIVACAGRTSTATNVAPDGPPQPRSCGEFRNVTADTIIHSISGSIPGFVSREYPRYPVELRNAGITGTVLSSFVARGSAVVISETRRQFGDAVCAWLEHAHFAPLSANGRKLTVELVGVETRFDITR